VPSPTFVPFHKREKLPKVAFVALNHVFETEKTKKKTWKAVATLQTLRRRNHLMKPSPILPQKKKNCQC
jgi:hypothetical protein